MKKLVTGIVLSSLISMPVFAQVDTEWFVGAGVGYQNDDVSGVNEQNGEDAMYQLRGGAILNDHHRLMGTVGYMDKSEQTSFLASYDYLLPVANNINVFAGVSAGVADNEIYEESSTDFVYGGQVGVQYEFNSNWTTELTYRYLEQDYEEANTEIENSQQVFLSVDYHF